MELKNIYLQSKKYQIDINLNKQKKINYGLSILKVILASKL